MSIYKNGFKTGLYRQVLILFLKTHENGLKIAFSPMERLRNILFLTFYNNH